MTDKEYEVALSIYKKCFSCEYHMFTEKKHPVSNVPVFNCFPAQIDAVVVCSELAKKEVTECPYHTLDTVQ